MPRQPAPSLERWLLSLLPRPSGPPASGRAPSGRRASGARPPAEESPIFHCDKHPPPPSHAL